MCSKALVNWVFCAELPLVPECAGGEVHGQWLNMAHSQFHIRNSAFPDGSPFHPLTWIRRRFTVKGPSLTLGALKEPPQPPRT